ncbi:het-domain-containing protein [Fusarium flagelliforme]|uniref:Het-domain-containing protein n=1 Tax=Fusarium flagelliforme TaxID=2675880 RepID=A0A395MWZ6_9HYPO|nr:het-domain-containing protein [Fusarium flagelliforme]
MDEITIGPKAEASVSPPSEQKCAVCENLDVWPERTAREYRYKQSTAMHFKSLVDDCGYCQLIKSTIIQFDLVPPHDSVFFVRTEEGLIRISAIGFEDRPPWNVVIHTPDQSQIIPHLRTFSPYLESCDLDTSVSFIKTQLSKCQEDHPAWEKTETPLPTRAIYIGPSNSHIRLFEAKGMMARYVTLSHCWGGEQPTITTMSNLAALTDCIDFDSLPIVFQQAILVARKLGVEYIWIDSLCIIQDSQSDWELESAKMCDYYENAYLTISTATSPNPNVPFLGPRDIKWKPIELQLVTEQGAEPMMAQRIATTPEEQGKLFTRGWAWQESAMSSQMVYFTPSELIWECSKCDVHVVPQRYIPDSGSSQRLGFSSTMSKLRFGFASGRSRFAVQTKFAGQKPYPDDHWDGEWSFDDSTEPDASDFDYIWDMWNDLVGYYSRRELTFLLDQLPALSGVASRVYEVTTSQYLAGIWEDSLPVSLCWVQEDQNDEALPLPKEYLAPSWSWASVVRGVEFPIERTISRFEPAIAILEAKCHVPGLNPFGRVSDGYIKLRGKVFEAQRESGGFALTVRWLYIMKETSRRTI